MHAARPGCLGLNSGVIKMRIGDRRRCLSSIILATSCPARASTRDSRTSRESLGERRRRLLLRAKRQARPNPTDSQHSAPGGNLCSLRQDVARLVQSRQVVTREGPGSGIRNGVILRCLAGIPPLNFLRGNAMKSIDRDFPWADSGRRIRCDSRTRSMTGVEVRPGSGGGRLRDRHEAGRRTIPAACEPAPRSKTTEPQACPNPSASTGA